MSPSAWQKFLYLSGMKAAPDEHRDWIGDAVATPDPRRLGLLLALPNALMLSVAGTIMLLAFGDLLGLVFLAASVVAFAIGAGVPSLTYRRAQKIAAKNGLPSPEPERR